MIKSITICPKCNTQYYVSIIDNGRIRITCKKCNYIYERPENFIISKFKNYEINKILRNSYKIADKIKPGLSKINYFRGLNKKLSQTLSQIDDAINNLLYYCSFSNYFDSNLLTNWIKKYNIHFDYLSFKYFLIDEKNRKNYKYFGDIYKRIGAIQKEYNGVYIEHEVGQRKEYFDNIYDGLKKPTDEQRRAIVIDEINNFINAGAGSGKTQTIIGKVKYLNEIKDISPEDILVLTYNNNIAKEVKEKFSNVGLGSINVNTFHAFGYSLVSKLKKFKKNKPSVAFDNEYEIKQFIQSRFDEYLDNNKTFQEDIIKYFLYYLIPYKPIPDFNNLEEYEEYIRSFEIITIKTKPNGIPNKVKSFEECYIANYLFSKGIEYEYERSYKYDTSTEDKTQYEPDFYLSQYDIWLEHFAINKDTEGNLSSPYGDEYIESYNWKLSLHKDMKTELISTYSYEFTNNNLFTNLETSLKEHGVELNSLSNKDIINELKKTTSFTINPFTDLLIGVLNHYKSNQYTPNDLDKLVHQSFTNKRLMERSTLFFKLFLQIYNDYSQLLDTKPKTIDFSDQINYAIDVIKSNEYKNPYKYIIVDEFQDISIARYRMLKSLIDKKPDCKLYVVGDDWQSIYKFSGSDVSILYDFSNYFGFTKTQNLTKTFRFNQKLAEISNKFILKNDRQLDKEMYSDKDDKTDPITFISKLPYKEIANPNHDIEIHLNRLCDFIIKKNLSLKKSGGEIKKKEILILNRYRRKNVKRYDSIIKKYKHNEFINIRFTSIHSSKGTESDYVFIDDVNKRGFPSIIQDDPIINLFLKSSDNYKFSEERRLFYVALTRAKSKVFILYNGSYPSEFVNEIKEDLGLNIHCKNINCNGIMIEKKGEDFHFLGCSNYPKCTFTMPI